MGHDHPEGRDSQFDKLWLITMFRAVQHSVSLLIYESVPV
jgi:hypothetical protein